MLIVKTSTPVAAAVVICPDTHLSLVLSRWRKNRLLRRGLEVQVRVGTEIVICILGQHSLLQAKERRTGSGEVKAS